LAHIGTECVRQNKSLILRVPSVVVAGDFNALINPAHPEFKYVKIHSNDHYENDIDCRSVILPVKRVQYRPIEKIAPWHIHLWRQYPGRLSRFAEIGKVVLRGHFFPSAAFLIDCQECQKI
jgi:hypothetical protein